MSNKAKNETTKKPTYDLKELQDIINDNPVKKFTRSSYDGMCKLGISPVEAVEVILTIEEVHFYKSMPCNDNSGWFQDVYRVPYKGTELYIKFTFYPDKPVVISFKER